MPVRDLTKTTLDLDTLLLLKDRVDSATFRSLVALLPPVVEERNEEPGQDREEKDTPPRLEERSKGRESACTPSHGKMYHPARPSALLSPELQQALDAYHQGHTTCRKLGEVIGVKKTKAAELLQQLRAKRLIDE